MTPIQATPETTPETPTPEVETPIRLRFDADGRAIPLTDAERAAYIKRAKTGLEKTVDIPDDDPLGETEAFMRAIDEGRPHRPLFEGYY